MKRLALFCALVLILALAAPDSASYVRDDVNGSPIFWDRGGRVTYELNPAGSDDVPFPEVERAVAGAFQVWEDVPTSTVSFARGPDTTLRTAANDGRFPVFWVEDGAAVDGQDISGVAALTFVYRITGGRDVGQIVDANIVFNGRDYRWATGGDPGSLDIGSVAAHEIGHAIGLAHSPVLSATMFWAAVPGDLRRRTLATDDRIGTSVIYPTSDFLAATGVVGGRVRDTNSAPVFGAHVVAVDQRGNVTAGALSQPDGGYQIRGLPPGRYAVYAEALGPDGGLVGRRSLGPFYGSAETEFGTTPDAAAEVMAGRETGLDFQVTRGAPGIRITRVRGPGGLWSSVGVAVSPGDSNVTVGVRGIGLPTSGDPLSVSGSGVTVLGTQIAGLSDGTTQILLTFNVSPDAPAGARNLIVADGARRAVATGALEILGGADRPAKTVSAASFSASALAPESIAATFGLGLAATTESATVTPLPTSLGGTSVSVRDGAGVARPAPLFFVSPTQINFLVPAGTAGGTAAVTVFGPDGGARTEWLSIDQVSPGLFTANADGRGVAAALAWRLSAGGGQSFEPIAAFDPGAGRYLPLPVDLGPEADQVFLVLFGTGLRARSSLAAVSARIGGAEAQVTYAGPQGDFLGLDQVNVRLPRGLAGRGEVDVTLIVDGREANPVKVHVR